MSVAELKERYPMSTWYGASKAYEYEDHELATPLTGGPTQSAAPRGATFIYSRAMGGTFDDIYIGEAADLRAELNSLVARPCISSYQADHIHIRYNNDPEARLFEVADLLARYRMPCKQSRSR